MANINDEKIQKDISQLSDITRLAAELQDKIERYNIRQRDYKALYGMDKIVGTIWLIARNLRDELDD